jgi:hypothetical integral membrane protein (TIGR02206 family)
MTQFFIYDYHGAPFVLFGTGHIIALLVIVLINLAMLGFRKAPERVRQAVRWSMVIVLCLDDLAWQLWNAYWGHWSIQTMLPLNLCSLMMVLAVFMLIFKNQRLYEFVYFLGIGGAFQALMTPPVGIYGFPHFRIFQTLIAHGLLLTSAVYLTTVEGFRPTWKSLLQVLIGVNIYMLLVGLINRAIGSNYLFLAYKPAPASLLDLLPDWPWYIIWMEVIGLVMCLILYLPFAIKDWRGKAGVIRG